MPESPQFDQQQKTPNRFLHSPVIPLLAIGAVFILFALIIRGGKKTQAENFFKEAKNIVSIIEGKDEFAEFFRAETASLPSSYSIYIKNLKKNKAYEFNSKEAFPLASVYKLAVLYKAYDAINKGNLTPSTTLSMDQAKLDKTLSPKDKTDASPTPSPKNAEEQIISMPVSEALRLMITISDNYAAQLLAEKLGWTNTEKFLVNEEINVDLTSTNSPKASASEIAKILEKIYKGEAVNKIASQEMIDLLKKQTVNDRIPKNLPEDIIVAHKTGELDGIRNDAGIVYGQKGDYIFVFFSDTNQPLDAVDKIATLSQKFYEELESD